MGEIYILGERLWVDGMDRRVVLMMRVLLGLEAGIL